MSTTDTHTEGKLKRKRVKTPTCLQMEAVECGAAALRMVLGYYGKFLPLEVLRTDCGVSRDGSKASNIIRAARKHGLVAKGYKKTITELAALRMPAILFWNFNHFLVLEGFDEARNIVWVNDPAQGPRKIDWKEFKESYTGVVLVFEPGEEFETGGEKPSVLRALKRRLTGAESALLFVSLAALGLVLPGIVIPVFSMVFVDYYLVGRSQNLLMPLLLAMTVTALLRGFLVWLQKYYLLRMETKLALVSSSKFFWHVLRLPIEFFTQRYAGDIGNRVHLNDRVARLLSGDLATAAFNLFSAAFLVLIMLTYSASLTLIGVGFAAVNIATLTYVARKRADGNMRLTQEDGKQFGVAVGGLQIIETLKACSRKAFGVTLHDEGAQVGTKLVGVGDIETFGRFAKG